MTQLCWSVPPSSPTTVGSAVEKMVCPSETSSIPSIRALKTSGTLFLAATATVSAVAVDAVCGCAACVSVLLSIGVLVSVLLGPTVWMCVSLECSVCPSRPGNRRRDW